MAWGIVEQHPEVRDYLENLSDKQFGRAAFYVDLLEREGNRLGFPTVSHLGGKVWELRIPLGRGAQGMETLPGGRPHARRRRRMTRGTMVGHDNWKQLKERRLASPPAKAAYEQARLEYELGLRIRELRDSLGMSQAELARRMGTSQPAIARLEAGGGNPKVETIERAAAALNATLTVVFETATGAAPRRAPALATRRSRVIVSEAGKPGRASASAVPARAAATVKAAPTARAASAKAAPKAAAKTGAVTNRRTSGPR